jgi:asparagine synthase (glutamine-hydrolysing)
MCGIAGFVLGSTARIDATLTLRSMIDPLTHRGPDGWGIHLDRGNSVGLGHRRLAIVDLSAEGHQPMVSRTGRYVITYNGEVYNFGKLRAELEPQGFAFRGHSDTEVVLAAIEAWGVEGAVRRFVGMFAFALWDRAEQELWLVRDRLGKKPLYYGMIQGSVVFASELKSLRRFPGFPGQIDPDALALYLRHNYVPGPRSIYQSIMKLAPGTLRKIRIREGSPEIGPESRYWSIRDVFNEAREIDFKLAPSEAVEALDTVLREAVRERMVADVPLGAFLSGGVDSSTVVALMQAQSARPVKTFSIGFHESAYNEAHHAARVAQHLGTDHTEIYVTAEDALAVVPMLPSMFDEPFSDSSQIPTYLVAKIARQQVTVALSGDGGDELFCGYPRYRWWRTFWAARSAIPSPLRRSLAQLVRGVGIDTWNGVLAPIVWLAARSGRPMSVGNRLHKLAELLTLGSPELVYRGFISHWMRPDDLVIGGVEPETPLSATGGPTDLDGFTQYMMLLDILTYLPDDILVKVDRASMAVSLEARGPLLDHRVVEMAAQLPLDLKLRGSTDKWILRQVLSRYVPPRLFNRPKMGFGVPISSWLRGPLRDWAEALLDESALRSHGLLNPAPIRKVWREYIENGYPWHYSLWDILMFQAWFREQGNCAGWVRHEGVAPLIKTRGPSGRTFGLVKPIIAGSVTPIGDTPMGDTPIRDRLQGH